MKILLFFLVLRFLEREYNSKEAVHIFLDALIFDDKLTGSIFTLNYVSQRRLVFILLLLRIV